MSPLFWYNKNKRILPCLLQPLCALYQWGVEKQTKRVVPTKLHVPLICVGNLTVGGSGKTPTVHALVQALESIFSPIIVLSKGYKGDLTTPSRVDLHRHTARTVGDEALLHAALTQTWIGRDRAKVALAAQAALKDRSSHSPLFIMDDGYQNPSLAPDFRLLVVDGPMGFGNENILPAGPLREPILKGLARADAILVIDTPNALLKKTLTSTPHLNIFYTKKTLSLPPNFPKKVIAFAGIAHPHRFFESLKEKGIVIQEALPFPDHYYFTEKDLERLKNKSHNCGLPLVTTQKDFVRLPSKMQKEVLYVPLSLTLPSKLVTLICQTKERFHEV